MIRNRWLAAGAAVALLPAAAAAAQSMGGMPMPGMTMPDKPAAKAKPSAKPQPRKTGAHPTQKRLAKHPPRRATARSAPPSAPMRGMNMSAPAAGSAPQSMPGMDMPSNGAPTPAAPSAMPNMPMPPSAAPAPQAMPGMDMPAPPAGQPEPSPKTGGQSGTAMPGMDMPGMAMPGGDLPGEGSGTSRLPGAEGAMHGLHLMAGKWMVMLHGYAWGNYTDQSGPRGRDEAFDTSMAMIDARHDLGGGTTLQLRSMLSLDALMGPKGYPSLLATGESADGVTPLVDRQHPHDLFMELSARIDVPLGGKLTGFVYGGPVAEPALGPSAFMHRRSAKYLPLAPITHHWFDSTHITFGVVTAGLSTSHWQFEGSAFRGREPDQHRWDIETPKLDSWSVRATWNPSSYWSAQASYGRLKSPEALEPDVDEARTTASVQYARGGFSALAGFGMKNRLPGRTLIAWLAEANWDLTDHHSVFGRVENVANDELFPDPIDPLHDRKFRVTRAELGYAYRIKLIGPLEAAIGGSGFVIAKPDALDAAYGRGPAGWTGFIKLSVGG
jgi:hypothetical protein